MKRAILTVSGEVQGVGFRDIARRAARKCSIAGTVENMDDGTVRISCEGEEDDIGKFTAALRRAEFPAEVDDIRAEYSEPTGEYRRFAIIRGEDGREDRESMNTGIAILHQMNEKQDAMLEKQDAMLEKQDAMLEKQDAMLEKQDATIDGIRQMNEKQDAMLEKQDATIDGIRQMNEKQDAMLEKQDATIDGIRQMNEKQDAMLEKQDAMLEKQDATVDGIRQISSDIRVVVDARLRRVEEDVAKIKTRLSI